MTSVPEGGSGGGEAPVGRRSPGDDGTGEHRILAPRMRRSWARLCFCILVALVSAALADPLLETASNAGLFGRGNYTDHSTLNIVPVLCVGALVTVLHLSMRVLHLLENADLTTGESLCPLLPRIFAGQMLVLFGMETAEQIVTAGHPLGGTLWLGAPVAISLAGHATMCLVVSVVAAVLLRRFAHVALRLAHFVLRPSRHLSRIFCPIVLGRALAAPGRILAPTTCRIGERAPPFLRA
jgi:hypothetical protein